MSSSCIQYYTSCKTWSSHVHESEHANHRAPKLVDVDAFSRGLKSTVYSTTTVVHMPVMFILRTEEMYSSLGHIPYCHCVAVVADNKPPQALNGVVTCLTLESYSDCLLTDQDNQDLHFGVVGDLKKPWKPSHILKSRMRNLQSLQSQKFSISNIDPQIASTLLHPSVSSILILKYLNVESSTLTSMEVHNANNAIIIGSAYHHSRECI